MNSASSYIVVRNVWKSFLGKWVLKGVSLTVNAGEIVSIVGPNAAGKTTLLRVITGLLKPSRGYVEVLGYRMPDKANRVYKCLSYLPEELGRYDRLSVGEYLEFCAQLYGISDVREAIEYALSATKLPRDVLRRRMSELSKGTLRRVHIARVLMVKPKVLVLDEPTSGLDVLSSISVRKVVREYVKSHRACAIVSSHNMLEVEYLCDRLYMIYDGRIISEGTPHELKSRYGASNLEEVFEVVVNEYASAS